MATATPSPPLTYETVSGTGGNFTTPERIREYAQEAFDRRLKDGVPELRPTVEVGSVPTGISIRLSVTREGYQGPTSEVRVYPAKRLAEEPQLRSAIWFQYLHLLRHLKPAPLPPDEDE